MSAKNAIYINLSVLIIRNFSTAAISVCVTQRCFIAKDNAEVCIIDVDQGVLGYIIGV